MSIKTIDPHLSQEYALKPKKTVKRENIPRHILKELCGLEDIPERMTEKSEIKKIVSDLKRKKRHSDVDILRKAEERKIKSEVLPSQIKAIENRNLLIDPLSFLNHEGTPLIPQLPEKPEKVANSEALNLKPNENPSLVLPPKHQVLTQPSAKYPFEKIEENYKPGFKVYKKNYVNNNESSQRSSESKQDYKVRYEWEYSPEEKKNNDCTYYKESFSNDHFNNKENSRQNRKNTENFRYESKSNSYANSNYGHKYSNSYYDSKIDFNRKPNSRHSKFDDKFSCSVRHKRRNEHESKFNNRFANKSEAKFDRFDKRSKHSEDRRRFHNDNVKGLENSRKYEKRGTVRDSDYEWEGFIDLREKKVRHEDPKPNHKEIKEHPCTKNKSENSQKIITATDSSPKAKSEILNSFFKNSDHAKQHEDIEQEASFDSCVHSQESKDSQFTFNPESKSSKNYLINLTECEEKKVCVGSSQPVCNNLPLKRISMETDGALEKRRKLSDNFLDEQDYKKVENSVRIEPRNKFSKGNKIEGQGNGSRSDCHRKRSSKGIIDLEMTNHSDIRMENGSSEYYWQGEMNDKSKCSRSVHEEKKMYQRSSCVSYKY